VNQLTNTIIKTKLSPAVTRDGFEGAFYSLPFNIVLRVKRDIYKETGWSRTTFYTKRNGDVPLREDELPKLRAVFSKYGYEFWTGPPKQKQYGCDFKTPGSDNPGESS